MFFTDAFNDLAGDRGSISRRGRSLAFYSRFILFPSHPRARCGRKEGEREGSGMVPAERGGLFSVVLLPRREVRGVSCAGCSLPELLRAHRRRERAGKTKCLNFLGMLVTRLVPLLLYHGSMKQLAEAVSGESDRGNAAERHSTGVRPYIHGMSLSGPQVLALSHRRLNWPVSSVG